MDDITLENKDSAVGYSGEYPQIIESEETTVELEIVVGDTIYYLPAPDGSIGSFARWKFSENAIEAPEPIVRGYDGKLYLESQAPEAPTQNYQELRAAAYPDLRDYLDAQVKINSGNEPLSAEGQFQLEAYYQACLAVKEKYPKPKNNITSE